MQTNVPIEVREMRRLHAFKVDFEHQESEQEYKELKKLIKRFKIQRKKRSGGS